MHCHFNPGSETSMKKFYWIDCGYSFKQAWNRRLVDLDFHASTLSLISSHLRGRKYICSKIFVSLRSDAAKEAGSAVNVMFMESGFDFLKYIALTENSKLNMFARWCLETINSFSPDFVSDAEIDNILQELERVNYIFAKSELISLNIVDGKGCNAKCRLHFIHSPYEVSAFVKLPGSKNIIHLPDHTFRRDEVSYLKSVALCEILDGKLFINMRDGNRFSIDIKITDS
jgi:hypothetical protein